jgi:hypothetical protein
VLAVFTPNAINAMEFRAVPVISAPSRLFPLSRAAVLAVHDYPRHIADDSDSGIKPAMYVPRHRGTRVQQQAV